MLQRTFKLAFWLAVTVAVIMATLPTPPELVNQSDKVQHMLAFAVMTALALGAWPGLPVLRIGILLSALGVGIELLQMIPPIHRDSDAWDWVADTVAILAVMAVVSMVRLWRRSRAQAV